MTSKRFDLVKNLYAFVLSGETEETKRSQRLAQLKNIISKEIISEGAIKLSPAEETAIYTTTLKEELDELMTSGKDFNDPEVKSLIEKLKEVGAEPAILKIKEDAKKLEELRKQKQEFYGGALREEHPVGKPQPKEELLQKNKPQPKEEPTPKYLELSTEEEDLSDEAIIKALQEKSKEEETPLSKTKKKVEQKPSKFKTKEEIAIEKDENKIKEKYKNGELSFNEAKDALKELIPSLSDSVIRNKLSIIKPLTMEEVTIEKFLTNPSAPKVELLKELKEKYNAKLSDTAKLLKDILSPVTSEKTSTVFEVDNLSPSSVEFQLSIKKDEYLRIFGDSLQTYSNELNNYYKNEVEDPKEQKILYNSLSEESKKLDKLLKLLFSSVEGNEVTEQKLISAKDFILNKFDTSSKELTDYYKKMKEFENTAFDKKEPEPKEEIPNETNIWAKPEAVFMRSGDIIEEREEDGKKIKVYAPTSRKLIPCPNGHNSTQFELDKKTKMPVKRTHCEYCGANISTDEIKEKMNELQKQIDLEIENEREKNREELNNNLISKEEFTKRENDLSESNITQYKNQLNKIRERKLQPIKNGYEKLNVWLDEKKIDQGTYDKKIHQLLEKEKEISDETDLVSLKAQLTALTPKPYWELQYGVKVKGPWGLADKSRTRAEDILESGQKAPTEGERYKVQTVLDKMNVVADEFGNPIFKTNEDGTQEAEALPKGKEVFFTVSDLLKKLNFGSPREFKILLAEQEIKNEFLNDQETFDNTVEKLTTILNGNNPNLTQQDEIKNTIIAKEKLILEQLKYKKIDREVAVSQLEELGVNKEEAMNKVKDIIQFDNLPQATPYLVTRPSYDVKREDTGRMQNKTYVWGDDARNAIWNLNTIRPALIERINYVEDILKPQAKVYKAIVNAFTARNEILKIKETLKKKEESLGLNNKPIKEAVKDLIDALKNDPELLNRFGRFQLKDGKRKGLKEELINYMDEVESLGEEPTEDQMVILNGGRREPTTGKTYMQLALDLLEQQKYETKPFNDAVKKLKSAEKAFLKHYDALPHAVKERMKGKLFPSEGEELDIDKTEEPTKSEKSSLDALVNAINDLEKNPEVVPMANNLSDQEKEEEDAAAALEALQSKSSLRMERIISLAIACLD